MSLISKLHQLSRLSTLKIDTECGYEAAIARLRAEITAELAPLVQAYTVGVTVNGNIEIYNMVDGSHIVLSVEEILAIATVLQKGML